jgi:hypothetical protein
MGKKENDVVERENEREKGRERERERERGSKGKAPREWKKDTPR